MVDAVDLCLGAPKFHTFSGCGVSILARSGGPWPASCQQCMHAKHWSCPHASACPMAGLNSMCTAWLLLLLLLLLIAGLQLCRHNLDLEQTGC